MITVTCFNNGKKDRHITLKGHSELAAYGSDIVCAAVSALVYTLTQYINMHDSGGFAKIRLETGYADIEYNSCPQNIMAVFDAVTDGFRLIASNYPSNVKYIAV